MTPTDRVISRTFAVGVRFRCTLSIPLDASPGVRMATVEWSPHPPNHLSPSELADYRKGRDGLVADLVRLTGVTTTIVEPT